MNPQEQFCRNTACPASGKIGQGNIVGHGKGRCKCKVCGKTFSETAGTALYGLKTPYEVVTLVMALLAYGCPVQAIVMAFNVDERTVRSWLRRAGEHCQAVHEHLMADNAVDLGQVQADEIKVKAQKGTYWMALAMMVSTRFWLGGAVSPRRDKHLIRALAQQVYAWALCRPMLISVDGLSSYIKVFQGVFRSKLPRWGQRGRCRLRPWDDLAIVQVVKQRQPFSIDRRIVQGTRHLIEQIISHSQGAPGQINTAYIERLNATFRQRLASLTRRSRSLVCRQETLTWGMYLIGCTYNLCTNHDSLALPLWMTERHIRWVHRTPAMALGLTDHQWTVEELLCFKVPTSFKPPKRRGRPPKHAYWEAVA
jgi:transposase-like protein